MRNKKKNWVKIGLILLAVLFTAQSCNFGGGQSETVELTWWKVFDDPRIVQPLIQEFQKQYPGVRIKYVEKDIETYEDELVDALASGRGPDIFTIHNDWLPKHQEKIAPFPPEIFSKREYDDTFVDVASFDLTDEENIYAVPLAVDVLAAYYNKDILASAGIARAPQTWEELVNLTPSMTRRDISGNFSRSAVAMGTSENVNRSPDILSLLMLQNGTPFYSENYSTATFDRRVTTANGDQVQPGARALEFYTQFADPSKTSYTWNTRSNNSIEAFAAGKVGMIFSYSYLRDTLADRAPFLNYDIAPVPQISTDQTKINFANYWAETVSAQSKNSLAAHTFLKYITSREVLPLYYEIQKLPSSRIDLIEEQIKDPEIGVFAENALSARSFYKPDSDAVEGIFVQMIDDVILRDVSPADAIRSAAQKVNLLLRNL